MFVPALGALLGLGLLVLLVFRRNAAAWFLPAKAVQPTLETRTLQALASSCGALPPEFVVFDLETTGLRTVQDHIIEIAAVRVIQGQVEAHTFSSLVRAPVRLPGHITRLTGISERMLRRQGVNPATAVRAFLEFAGEAPLVAFNASFDRRFLWAAAQRHGLPEPRNTVICALKASRAAWPGRRSYKLQALARDLRIPVESAHRALSDVVTTLHVLLRTASAAPR